MSDDQAPENIWATGDGHNGSWTRAFDRIKDLEDRLAKAEADVTAICEDAAEIIENMSKNPHNTWGQVKAAIRALGDAGNRDIYQRQSEKLKSVEAQLAAAREGTLQSRVAPWMMACFGQEVSADKLERSDRFLEEALELLQSNDYSKERIAALVEYVYGREKGEAEQETGGVMITLAAYCLAHGIDMHDAGEKELARVWTKIDKIRSKQAAKPTGSALPVALSEHPAPIHADVTPDQGKMVRPVSGQKICGGYPTGDAGLTS